MSFRRPARRQGLKLLVAVFVLFSVLSVPPMARADERDSALDLDLGALRWKNRVLVVSSPSGSDPSFRLQKRDLEANADGVLERDLMILEILQQGESRVGDRLLSEKAVQHLLRDLGVRPGLFQVLLIGKDGTVKLRSEAPVPVKDLFALIDSMPMRRREMDTGKD